MINQLKIEKTTCFQNYCREYYQHGPKDINQFDQKYILERQKRLTDNLQLITMSLKFFYFTISCLH